MWSIWNCDKGELIEFIKSFTNFSVIIPDFTKFLMIIEATNAILAIVEKYTVPKDLQSSNKDSEAEINSLWVWFEKIFWFTKLWTRNWKDEW